MPDMQTLKREALAAFPDLADRIAVIGDHNRASIGDMAALIARECPGHFRTHFFADVDREYAQATITTFAPSHRSCGRVTTSRRDGAGRVLDLFLMKPIDVAAMPADLHIVLAGQCNVNPWYFREVDDALRDRHDTWHFDRFIGEILYVTRGEASEDYNLRQQDQASFGAAFASAMLVGRCGAEAARPVLKLMRDVQSLGLIAGTHDMVGTATAIEAGMILGDEVSAGLDARAIHDRTLALHRDRLGLADMTDVYRLLRIRRSGLAGADAQAVRTALNMLKRELPDQYEIYDNAIANLTIAEPDFSLASNVLLTRVPELSRRQANRLEGLRAKIAKHYDLVDAWAEIEPKHLPPAAVQSVIDTDFGHLPKSLKRSLIRDFGGALARHYRKLNVDVEKVMPGLGRTLMDVVADIHARQSASAETTHASDFADLQDRLDRIRTAWTLELDRRAVAAMEGNLPNAFAAPPDAKVTHLTMALQ